MVLFHGELTQCLLPDEVSEDVGDVKKDKDLDECHDQKDEGKAQGNGRGFGMGERDDKEEDEMARNDHQYQQPGCSRINVGP